LVLDHVNCDAPPEGTLVGAAVNVSVGAPGAAIATLAVRVTVPPAPEHASVYALADVNGPTAEEPETARAPVQSPLATQLVALVLLQAKVELPPLATLSGDAENVSVGAAAGACTITVTLADPLPPVPVHESEKVEFADSGPTLCVPLTALVPDHPPDAVQLVAFVADHVSVEEPPIATEVGLAVKVVTGAAGGGGAVLPT
jgi:hypothetical protein